MEASILDQWQDEALQQSYNDRFRYRRQDSYKATEGLLNGMTCCWRVFNNLDRSGNEEEVVDRAFRAFDAELRKLEARQYYDGWACTVVSRVRDYFHGKKQRFSKD